MARDRGVESPRGLVSVTYSKSTIIDLIAEIL